MITTEPIQHLLEPEFVASLDRRALDDLRPMRDEAHDVENTVSYYRRLAQARIEIVIAERARREQGGSLEELIAQLPLILGADARRSSPGTTRVAEADKIPTELHWPDSRERILEDSTLAENRARPTPLHERDLGLREAWRARSWLRCCSVGRPFRCVHASRSSSDGVDAWCSTPRVKRCCAVCRPR
jgi:hypothetical protein